MSKIYLFIHLFVYTCRFSLVQSKVCLAVCEYSIEFGTLSTNQPKIYYRRRSKCVCLCIFACLVESVPSIMRLLNCAWHGGAGNIFRLTPSGKIPAPQREHFWRNFGPKKTPPKKFSPVHISPHNLPQKVNCRGDGIKLTFCFRPKSYCKMSIFLNLCSKDNFSL